MVPEPVRLPRPREIQDAILDGLDSWIQELHMPEPGRLPPICRTHLHATTWPCKDWQAAAERKHERNKRRSGA